MVDILPILALPGIVLHFLLKRAEGAPAPSARTHAPVYPPPPYPTGYLIKDGTGILASPALESTETGSRALP